MLNMLVGYSFWGFLGDIKYNKDFEKVSTPDGNAFYSWSIIRAFQSLGMNVKTIFPDRDKFGYDKLGIKLFSSWGEGARHGAYSNSLHVDYDNIDFSHCTYDDIKKVFDKSFVFECSFILHEWRMKIIGRNDYNSRQNENWQPDLFLQDCLIRYCNENNIPMILFDLDYKLLDEDVERIKKCAVIELGDKWNRKNKVLSKRVNIPFCFDIINEFRLKKSYQNNLVYVGNRYERDWCIDKYIPLNSDKIKIYGNWNEGNRNSKEKWPLINFCNRLQTSEMRSVYSNSATTILLAKEEYCKEHFMTARIIEAVFYGCLPLFIDEYGDETISYYAGDFNEILKVKNSNEVKLKSDFFAENSELRNKIIIYLRDRLRVMDAMQFACKIVELYFKIY